VNNFIYWHETFTEEESSILRRYFTNLDKPVFALVNLPEVVKGALFARYSRSSKSLRRLFLDEFVGDLDVSGDLGVDATIGLKRAEELYDKVFLEYGDDSVAQLGGVHLACEQVSNLMTKILERPRLMSYLEQSTRYIAYDDRLANGHYRYFRDPEILASTFGAKYVGHLDRIFDTYKESLSQLGEFLKKAIPKDSRDSEFVYRRALRAKALDTLRGLLPASSLSNLGIYASGQSYEHLVMKLMANELPEARHYAAMMLDELKKVIPSFLSRVEKPDRGGQWIKYISDTAKSVEEKLEKLTLTGENEVSSPVKLIDFDPFGEDKVLANIMFEDSSASYETLERAVGNLSSLEKDALFDAYVGNRLNRRHKPQRAFESTYYTFEITSDYGAFRDLQRHRMLTITWQVLGKDLGYYMPDLVQEAGLETAYRSAILRAEELYEALIDPFGAKRASYALCLAHRIRYRIQLNAREAMHLIELRSASQGHPVYRELAQLMWKEIRDTAGHRRIADAMKFVDFSDAPLERLESERNIEKKREMSDRLNK
jgi:thymidylate synthase ThyX